MAGRWSPEGCEPERVVAPWRFWSLAGEAGTGSPTRRPPCFSGSFERGAARVPSELVVVRGAGLWERHLRMQSADPCLVVIGMGEGPVASSLFQGDTVGPHSRPAPRGERANSSEQEGRAACAF